MVNGRGSFDAPHSSEITQQLDGVGSHLESTADDRHGGRLVKVVSFGGSAGEDVDGLKERQFPSKQLTEDPFQSVQGYGRTLRIPPYSMEQLVLLAEAHPVHSSALAQKTSDIIAGGVQFIPKDPDNNDGQSKADQELKEDMLRWWDSLSQDFTSQEVLVSAWEDYETVGWGMWEVARDNKGNVGEIYYVPGHTVRSHTSGRLFAQIRQGRMVWFKRWNEEGDFYASSGKRVPSERVDKRVIANELLVLRMPTRRSTWYGIPKYVSAIGHLTLGIAARDYNILYFENAREPRIAFILTGMADDVDETLDALEQQLRVAHKDPHRNLLLPLTGDAKVTVERLALPQNDLHFAKMLEIMDEKVLAAHRMPAERLGIKQQGRSSSMGGNVASTMNAIYKTAIVARSQDFAEARLNKFILTEYCRTNKLDPEEMVWKVDLEELDVSDEAVDSQIVVSLVSTDLITMNEGRQRLRKSPREDFGDMTLSEWLKKKDLSLPSGQGPSAPPPPQNLPGKNALKPDPAGEQMQKVLELQDQLYERLEDIDDIAAMVLSEYNVDGSRIS